MKTRSRAAYQNSLALSQIAKRRRTGTCIDCGTITRYAGGRRGKTISDRCQPCAARANPNTKWDHDNIIECIQRYAREHGTPPVSSAWNFKNTKPDYAPYTQTVLYYFGTWADAIAAAGFDRPKIGQRPNRV